MYNELIKIGPVTVYGYGFMIAVGILCALWMTARRAKKREADIDIVYSLALIALLFGFVGAKVLFCIVEFKRILANPMEIFSGSGFVVYGGIIGGTAAVLLYCRKKRVRFLPYFDLIAPSVAVAQGFGRIGCFLAGCCYGRETDSLFGIVFHDSPVAPNGVRLIPTQLIMSAGNFLIAALLILYAKKPRAAGKVGALYLIMYSIGRFGVEFLRNDYRGSVGVLSTSQLIALFIFILGTAILFKDKLFRKKQNAGL